MNHLMKLSRLGTANVKPLCSLMSRNASHFTYVPDTPMENMGKSSLRFSSYNSFLIVSENS